MEDVGWLFRRFGSITRGCIYGVDRNHWRFSAEATAEGYPEIFCRRRTYEHHARKKCQTCPCTDHRPLARMRIVRYRQPLVTNCCRSAGGAVKRLLRLVHSNRAPSDIFVVVVVNTDLTPGYTLRPRRLMDDKTAIWQLLVMSNERCGVAEGFGC